MPTQWPTRVRWLSHFDVQHVDAGPRLLVERRQRVPFLGDLDAKYPAQRHDRQYGPDNAKWVSDRVGHRRLIDRLQIRRRAAVTKRFLRGCESRCRRERAGVQTCGRMMGKEMAHR